MIAKRQNGAAIGAGPRKAQDGAICETQRIYIIRDTPLTPEEWQKEHAGDVPLPIEDIQ